MKRWHPCQSDSVRYLPIALARRIVSHHMSRIEKLRRPRIHAFRNRGYRLTGDPVAHSAMLAIDMSSRGVILIISLDGSGSRILLFHPGVQSQSSKLLLERHRSRAGRYRSESIAEIAVDRNRDDGETDDQAEQESREARWPHASNCRGCLLELPQYVGLSYFTAPSTTSSE